MKKLCCSHMTKFAYERDLIDYSESVRFYSILLPDSDQIKDFCTHQAIWHCPWCGTKLPESLDDLWEEILEEEYGIKDPVFKEADKVPEEFKTDKWWKKRGL